MHAIKASAVEFLHSYHNLSTNLYSYSIHVLSGEFGGVREHPRTFAHLLIFNKMIMKAEWKNKVCIRGRVSQPYITVILKYLTYKIWG